ncbi:MAG: LysE family transporter [Thermodesulfobacteriota bacterium]
MNLYFFLKGLIIGFSIAAPVGPIGALCIRRTLIQGRAAGLVSGLGAATADAIYGFIAGFGLTFISDFLIHQQIGLRMAGGVFLCFLGIRTFLSKSDPGANEAKSNGLIRSYASTFFLTLTNPVTILSFAAIFAGLGITSYQTGYLSATTLVAGVFLGSGLWWFILSTGVGFFRSSLNTSGMRWINRLAGIIITGFGLFALIGWS